MKNGYGIIIYKGKNMNQIINKWEKLSKECDELSAKNIKNLKNMILFFVINIILMTIIDTPIMSILVMILLIVSIICLTTSIYISISLKKYRKTIDKGLNESEILSKP